MPTSITRKITWRGTDRTGRLEPRFQAWPCWTVRCNRQAVTAAAILLVNLLVLATWAAIRMPDRVIQGLTLLTGLVVCQSVVYARGLSPLTSAPHALLKSSFNALGLLAVLGTVIAFVSPGIVRAPELMAAILTSLLLLLVTRPFLRVMGPRRSVVESHVIVGSGAQARSLYRAMAMHEPKPGAEDRAGLSEERVLQPGTTIDCRELKDFALRYGFASIVVAEPDARKREALATALLECKLQGIAVYDAVDCYERVAGKVWLEGLRPDLLVYGTGFRPVGFYVRLKRVLDVTLAALLALVTAPVVLLVSIAIKLESAGPVLYIQQRMGLNGRSFRLFKFRTMREDAESQSGPVWSSEQDERITTVGRFLRKYRIDEIPQVFNILRGEMSFIGPRPERPHFVDMLQQRIDYYDLRQYVKPGITGWAQVMYTYGASVEDSYEKLQYDLYYLKHMSLRLDLKILCRTVMVVMQGRGR
jgi:sugar transferase (PEP-CTERM system associated)